MSDRHRWLAAAGAAVAGLLAATGCAPSDASDPATPTGPVAELLEDLTVAPEDSGDAYERAAFGDGWATTPSGCDTRDEVLAAESTTSITRGPDGCQIITGNWVSLYDNYTTGDPADLEIDHVVALAEAWESGAAAWPPARREAYANDTRRPDALIAVTAATNRAKSDRDPAEWMPSNRAAWCRYATAWITQKVAWQLSVDPAEHAALTNVLATCPRQEANR